MGKKLKKIANYISDNFDFEWKTMDRACQIICILIVVVVITMVLGISAVAVNFRKDEAQNVSTNTIEATEAMTYMCEPIEPVSVDKTEEPKKPNISEREIELLALVTMAEAEGESEKGQRLVIDTILNRVDSDYWPDTVTDVIYQSGQFSSMWNGRIDRCYVKDDIYNLVLEELVSRTNHDVVYFTAGDYGKYGTPLFREGNHYFASK